MAYFHLNETLTNLPHFSLSLQKLGLKFQIVCFETFCQTWFQKGGKYHYYL